MIFCDDDFGDKIIARKKSQPWDLSSYEHWLEEYNYQTILNRFIRKPKKICILYIKKTYRNRQFLITSVELPEQLTTIDELSVLFRTEARTQAPLAPTDDDLLYRSTGPRQWRAENFVKRWSLYYRSHLWKRRECVCISVNERSKFT